MADGEHRVDDVEQMRTLLHSLPVLVTIRSRDGTYTGVFTDHQVLDYPTPRDLIGERTEDVLNPPAAEAVMGGVRSALDTGEHQRIEFPITIGGEQFWRVGHLAPYDPPGEREPAEAIMVSFDVSAQKARERALYDALEVLGTHTSRTALEQGFCDRLVENPRYRMAWIGTVHRSETPVVRATADAGEYLDALGETCGGLAAAADPGVESLRSKELETVDRIESTGDDWADVATAHGAHAAVAVPLEQHGVFHGVLAVYLSDATYAVPWRESVLELYGDAVSYGLSAALRRWMLGSGSTAVLEVDVTDGMKLLDCCRRADVDAPVRVASVVPQADGTRYYLDPPASATANLTAAVADIDGVAPAEDAAFEDGLAVDVDARTPESRLVDLGVNFERFRLTASEVTITAAIPRAEAVRSVVDLLRDAYPGALFTVEWGRAAAQREPRLGTNVAALLTDRQYEALEVAYRSGYFEKERQHNLSEIAESQPVSRWTFGEHLRVAQRKLLAHLLD